MFKALTVLLFFPSITFGTLAAEIFPWGIVFALFFMRRISVPIFLLVSLLLVSCFYTAYTLVLHGGALEADIVRSLAAYLNVILLAQTLLTLGHDRA